MRYFPFPHGHLAVSFADQQAVQCFDSPKLVVAGGEAFIWNDASLCQLGCLAAKAVPLVLPISNTGISRAGLQCFNGVQETAAEFQEQFLARSHA